MNRMRYGTTEELAAWYDRKYTEMGDGWVTPPEECNRHLDDLGVPYNKNLELLDIGCGAGHFLAEAEKRVNCIGIDISKVAQGFGEQRCRSAIWTMDAASDAMLSQWLPFDYIVSIGSLEHVVELDKALDNIRKLLRDDGKFYFYCPNEKWVHEDQPNERTMSDAAWEDLFARHGLYTHKRKRWNDSTAFTGDKNGMVIHGGIVPLECTCEIRGIGKPLYDYYCPLHGEKELKPPFKYKQPQGTKLNVGSGQRPFAREDGWINLDSNPKWSPDVVADWNDLHMFDDRSMDLVVSYHSLEHVGCGEGDGFIKEAWRVLKEGGSLIVVVPDPRAIAQALLTHEIEEYTFNVNMYGAFMGDEQDRHRWSYTRQGLWEYLKHLAPWKDVHVFNWRPLAGADITSDWWYHGQEAVK